MIDVSINKNEARIVVHMLPDIYARQNLNKVRVISRLLAKFHRPDSPPLSNVVNSCKAFSISHNELSIS